MIRFALLSLLSLTANVYAAESTVDIDTAAKLYQAAAMREQVRASLGAMPEHIRQLFAADSSAKLSEPQLAAVSAAAVRGFRIDGVLHVLRSAELLRQRIEHGFRGWRGRIRTLV